jgi:phenylacetic acid degradation protein
MFFSFQGHVPVCHESSFVHPQATVIGNVIIGKDCYIGPGAVLRGDWGEIVLEDGCNVQESCCIHMFPGISVRLRQNAHVGHGAVIHGAELGENCMIGMNAVIMDDAKIGAGSIVGALAFVKAKTIIPERSLVVGNPAKVIREVSDQQLDWKTAGTELYQTLPKTWQTETEQVEPLREVPANRPEMKKVYAPFEKRK